jgi:alpha-N-arabinofuranosidase
MDSASIDHPNVIMPVSRLLNYAKDFSVDLEPYTVAVIEVKAK